jgi:hypothetical protein
MNGIEVYLDFVLVNMDSSDNFSINNILLRHPDFIPEPTDPDDIAYFQKVSDEVKRIGSSKFKYFIALSKDQNWFELTDAGRIAIVNGGHLKHLTKLTKEGQEKLIRQQRQDEIGHLDLLSKRFLYKARYLPYLLSIAALIVSLCTYFKPEDHKAELNKASAEIKVLRMRTLSLDSILKAQKLQNDTPFHRDTLNLQ